MPMVYISLVKALRRVEEGEELIRLALFPDTMMNGMSTRIGGSP